MIFFGFGNMVNYATLKLFVYCDLILQILFYCLRILYMQITYHF